MSEWQKVILGDYIEIKHGFAFKGDFFVNTKSHNILLTPGNFAIGGGYKADKLKYYEGEIPEDYILSGNDIIVTMTDLSKESDTLGYPAIVPDDDNTYLHNQRLGKVTYKKKGIEDGFLYYLMCSPEYRHEVLASATGTSIKHTSPKRIEGFSFYLPPMREQKAIAEVLSSLDDKIEHNRHMIETLEAMGKALFQSWFVNFDPVRAKAARHPTELPDAISTIFPDELVSSQLGDIPKGWEVSTLGQICDFQNGYAFSSKDWKEDGTIPVVKIGNIKPMLVDVDHCSMVSREVVKNLGRFQLKTGDILIGMTGYVGEVGLVPKRDRVPYLNQRVGRIMPIQEYDYSFVLSFCRDAKFKKEAENMAAGSAQANVSGNDIKKMRVTIPNKPLRKLFNDKARPLFQKILIYDSEANVLSQIRDTLLPKLMSGELRVGDVS